MTTSVNRAAVTSFAALMLLTSACRPDSGPDRDRAGESVQSTGTVPADTAAAGSDGHASGEVRTFDVTGRVRSTPPGGNYLVVDHKDIAGFMHAMTMPFAVSDTARIGSVSVGDSVWFKLELTPSGPVIHSIRRMQ